MSIRDQDWAVAGPGFLQPMGTCHVAVAVLGEVPEKKRDPKTFSRAAK
jgi:hypothetical protein